MAKGRKTGGRKAGTVNKITANVRDAFEQAFAQMGGVPQLVTWAKDNQGEFYKLFSRLLPVQVNADVTGHLTLEQLVAGKGPEGDGQ